MKARTIALILVTLAASFIVGFPHAPRTVHATLSVLYTGTTNTAIWFPFVTSANGYDTSISVQGDATSLEVQAEIWVYFYDLDGVCHYVTKITSPSSVLLKTTNSQWITTLSQIYPGVTGSLLILTNIPDARAIGNATDLYGTHTLALVPTVHSSTISSLGNNGEIVRRDGFNPPPGWNTLLPEQQTIDPSLHHTTLIFPHVVNAYGYDTGIAITNSYYEPGVTGRTATLYIYDKTGLLGLKAVISMDPQPGTQNPAVFRGYTGFLSQIVGGTDPRIVSIQYYAFYPQEPVEGWMIAVVNIPYANGYTFIGYVPTGIFSATGMAAQIDNNIYGVDGTSHQPQRLVAPPNFPPPPPPPPPMHPPPPPLGSRTAIFLPIVTSALGYKTCITLENTVAAAYNAHLYFYNLDGSLALSWTTTSALGAGEMALITIDPEEDILCTIGGTETFTVGNLGQFTGWMLIMANSPCVYATATLTDSGYNQMASYVGVADPDVIDVGAGGNIVRANPVPIDENSSGVCRLPYVTTEGGYDTAIVAIIPRNGSEWPGPPQSVPLEYSYTGYVANGNTAVNFVHEPSGGGGPILPADGPFMLSLTGWGLGHTGATTLTTPVYNTIVGVCYMRSDNDGDLEISITNPTDSPADLADVWNGQYSGDPLTDSDYIENNKKEKPGAISVANWNDTNEDGTPDIGEDGRDGNGNPLFPDGDMDLIPVKLTGTGMDQHDELIVGITDDYQAHLSDPQNAKTRIWKDRRKLDEETSRKFTIADLPKVIWVEGLNKSTEVGDIKLTLEGRKTGVVTRTDVISMTFVWAECTTAWRTRVTDPQDPQQQNVIPSDLNLQRLRDYITQNDAAVDGSYYGQGTFDIAMVDTEEMIGGRIVLEFQVSPPKVSASFGIDVLNFDIAQQVHCRWDLMESGDNVWRNILSKDFPAPPFQHYDEPTDPTGVDNTPDNPRGHIYISDDPRTCIYDFLGDPENPIPHNQWFLTGDDNAFFAARDTFRDFVRVKIGGGDFHRDPATFFEGSRCSEKKDWHEVHYLRRGPYSDVWRRDTWIDDSYSTPTGTGTERGTCTVQLLDQAVPENYTATYTAATRTWTVTGSVHGNKAATDANHNKIWVITFENQVAVQIVQQGDQFNDGDVFTFSVLNGLWASKPIGNGLKHGSCSVEVQPNAVTDGYTVTYVDNQEKHHQWKVERKSEAGNPPVFFSPNDPNDPKEWDIPLANQVTITIRDVDEDPQLPFVDGDVFEFSVFKTENTKPGGTGMARGFCSVTVNVAESDSYRVTYDANGNTWKATSDRHGDKPAIAPLPLNGWIIAFDNQVIIWIIPGENGFNDGDFFEFSVFGANNGKRGNISATYYPVLGNP